MKKIILLLPLLFIFLQTKAQNVFSDQVIIDPAIIPILKAGYVYNPSGPIKIIRVNIHYMLRTDGTGGFTETSDGYTNKPYNGYMFAEEIIKLCNKNWERNNLLNHQPIPAVPAIEKKVRLVLSGVFFHRNTSDYNLSLSSCGFTQYKENSGEVINVFLAQGGGVNGCATLYGDMVMARGSNGQYQLSVDNKDPWYNEMTANNINHEIGHNLGLLHPIRKNSGPCCDNVNGYCDDGCTDTPTWQQLYANGNLTPCDWNSQYSSNNLMDYNANVVALSPCQISKIHENIDISKLAYKSCSAINTLLNIANFTQNKLYIAKKVTIANTSKITVDNNSLLSVNSNEFIVSSEFEVKIGSQLIVNPIPACQ